jgi:hypothetical protein
MKDKTPTLNEILKSANETKDMLRNHRITQQINGGSFEGDKEKLNDIIKSVDTTEKMNKEYKESKKIESVLKNKENNVINCENDFDNTTAAEYYEELEKEGNKYVHFYFSEEYEKLLGGDYFKTCVVDGKEIRYTQEVITDTPNRPLAYSYEHPKGIDLIINHDQEYLGYGTQLSKNNVYENKEDLEFEKLTEKEKEKSVYFSKKDSNVVNLFNGKKRKM